MAKVMIIERIKSICNPKSGYQDNPNFCFSGKIIRFKEDGYSHGSPVQSYQRKVNKEELPFPKKAGLISTFTLSNTLSKRIALIVRCIQSGDLLDYAFRHKTATSPQVQQMFSFKVPVY